MNMQQVKFNTSIESQQQRLLAALKHESMTTVDIRNQLDILGVAPRIFELRNMGYNIKTHWSIVITTGGRHRVAKYVFSPGKYKGEK